MTDLVKRMTIIIPASDLLSAIWYSEGSGAQSGMDVTSIPENWNLVKIEKVGADVMIEVERKVS